MHTEYATVFGLGTGEIVLIGVVFLMFFGGKKVPELMRGLGQGVREFNAAKANIKQEIEDGIKKPADTSKETVEEKRA